MSAPHTGHPFSHTHGLADGCPRCAEHAETPWYTLDDENLHVIIDKAVHRDLAALRSDTEALAVRNVLNTLERAGHLARAHPAAVAEFLSRYGPAWMVVT